MIESRKNSLIKMKSIESDLIDSLLTERKEWKDQFEAIGDWSSWLSVEDGMEQVDVLSRNVEKGLPCGSESFVTKLSQSIGRVLEFRPQGRPNKRGGNE